jgi:hypothetical protein
MNTYLEMLRYANLRKRKNEAFESEELRGPIYWYISA